MSAKKFWLPEWARKMRRVFHRHGSGALGTASPYQVNRLLVIRDESRALAAASVQERNVEQMEAMEERLVALTAEAKCLLGVER